MSFEYHVTLRENCKKTVTVDSKCEIVKAVKKTFGVDDEDDVILQQRYKDAEWVNVEDVNDLRDSGYLKFFISSGE